jgi:hypothetical protein
LPRNFHHKITMPEVATHRYDPTQGVFHNLCSLPDFEATQVIDRLRRESRPGLKADYLARRRKTEEWLSLAARDLLGRTLDRRPAYFFLGDFSHLADASRPAALVVPISSLPPHATTFTLGDSMSTVEEPARRVYKLDEMVELFANGEAVAEFGLSDKDGFQSRFVEIQVWDGLPVPIHTL